MHCPGCLASWPNAAGTARVYRPSAPPDTPLPRRLAIDVARLVKRGEEHFYICRKEVRERLGTPVPRPLGFIAWTCSSKGGQGQWGGPLPARPLAVGKL